MGDDDLFAIEGAFTETMGMDDENLFSDEEPTQEGERIVDESSQDLAIAPSDSAISGKPAVRAVWEAAVAYAKQLSQKRVTSNTTTEYRDTIFPNPFDVIEAKRKRLSRTNNIGSERAVVARRRRPSKTTRLEGRRTGKSPSSLPAKALRSPSLECAASDSHQSSRRSKSRKRHRSEAEDLPDTSRPKTMINLPAEDCNRKAEGRAEEEDGSEYQIGGGDQGLDGFCRSHLFGIGPLTKSAPDALENTNGFDYDYENLLNEECGD
ncbi:hypothetical protein NDN08_003375 [Rhodosorus marinus]|uniref:Condensin complex subunit 2 n=1 Tax=Rhodosorus marinus TaxID=101924 RepID=A0AAV8UWB9_9RHOD|nr:hypothetical protein NDN08_003375 [Rhodosorus marinus]